MCLGASPALADDEVVHHVEPPRAPEAHPPTLSVLIYGGAQVPLEQAAICPSSFDCVLGLGIGVGAQIERRTADRIGLFAGYDFWLVDSRGVFELGSLHAARGGLRYTIDDSLIVHPFVDASFGLIAFGDTGSIVAIGGVVTAGGGAEIELSSSIAFVTAFEAWFFATGPFTTRDGAVRANHFGVNVAIHLTIGVSVLIGSVTAD